MKVRIERHSLALLVVPEGRLDFSAAAHFQQHLEQALTAAAGEAAPVIVDCVALEYVSSAGLRVFLQAVRVSQRTGTAFALSALQPAVREVFELSGFARLIPVHEDRDTALTQLSPKPAKERRMSVRSNAGELAALMRFLQEFCSAVALPASAVMPFELALEELFINIVMHGAPAGTAHVEVSLTLDVGRLTMAVADDGPPFDPLSLPPPDVTAGLHERRIGGQGVHLVRQMMDTVGYRREGVRNILTLSREIGR